VKLTRIAAKYNEMQKDGRLLSNRHSIEIVRKRIDELSQRIDMNQAPDRLANLAKLWVKFRNEFDNNKVIEAKVTAKAVDAEFEKAYHDYAAWQQMFEALDLDRKMVESEVKIAKDIQAMLTAEDAYELMGEVFAAIMRHVKEPKTLKALQYEFARIVGDGSVIEDTESSD